MIYYQTYDVMNPLTPMSSGTKVNRPSYCYDGVYFFLRDDVHNWFVMNDIDYQIGFVGVNIIYIDVDIPDTISLDQRSQEFIYMPDDAYSLFVLKWL